MKTLPPSQAFTLWTRPEPTEQELAEYISKQGCLNGMESVNYMRKLFEKYGEDVAFDAIMDYCKKIETK